METNPSASDEMELDVCTLDANNNTKLQLQANDPDIPHCSKANCELDSIKVRRVSL